MQTSSLDTAQLVNCLLSTHEALSLIPSTANTVVAQVYHPSTPGPGGGGKGIRHSRASLDLQQV